MRCENRIQPLRELADIQTGPFGSQLHKEDYVEIGTPIVTVEHLGNRTFTEQNLPKVSDNDRERLKKYMLLTGDIVFSRVGSVDRCSYVDEQHNGWMFSGRCLRVRPTQDIDSLYLYYYFCLESTQQFVRNIAVGATMPSINTKLLGEVPINVSDIHTQKKISGILSSIDDKIELNNKINENLSEQVFSLYRRMFVETANDQRLVCRADEYFDISIGKTPPRKEPQWFSNKPTDCTWVSIADMSNCGVYIGDSSEYLTHEAVERFNVKLVPSNTVILSFKLTVGRVAITDGMLTTNEAIAHFKTENPKINEYLYCYLKEFNYQTMGSTSSIAIAVNSKIIKAMPFVVPTDEELTEFHYVAEPLFMMIKSNQRENNRLSELRDSLLPKLMSGEIDVLDIQI